MSTCACDTAVITKPAVEARPTPQDLWKRYHSQRDGQTGQTENALVEQYLPLVRAVLGRLAMTLPDHVDADDLNSVGLVGLLQALRNYNPACGTSFETYARVRIRGAMLDELRRMDWVPRTVHEKSRKLQAVMARLEQELGCIPNEAQMARAMDLSLNQYTDLVAELRPATFVCLDAICTSDGAEAGSVCDVVADPGEEGLVEKVSQRELKQLIVARLKDLPDNQRKVLALYYGEDLHLREIAEVMGVTESRICQIHSQAILSVRSYLQRFEAGVAGGQDASRKS